MNAPPPAVSVVLPVPPGARRVSSTVTDCVHHLANLSRPFELLLVTADPAMRLECELLAERLPEVRLVETEGWRWGRAVRAGLRAAKGDILCYANADETSTYAVALMIAYAFAYPDTVLKVNRRTRSSLLRRLGSLLYNAECRRLLGVNDWDVNGTPKIFPRSCSRLLDLHRDDELIDVEFLLVCQGAGYRLLQVPVVTERSRGRWPTTSLRAALAMYRDVVRFREELRRLASGERRTTSEEGG